MQCGKDGGSSIFTKAALPYAKDALAPVISAETMGYHYDKHYAGYVKNANALTGGGAFRGKTPEAVIKMTADDPSKAAIFNNAAQAWNHAFFFKCLKPEGGGVPQGRLAEMIDASFGGFNDFKIVFLTAAKDQFGSGWVWLVKDGDKTGGGGQCQCGYPAGARPDPAGLPWMCGNTPITWIIRTGATDFVQGVLDNLANWEFVAEQLDKALPETTDAESGCQDR